MMRLPPMMQERLRRLPYRRILQITSMITLIAFPFLLFLIYTLSQTNAELRATLSQQAKSTHDLASVKGEIKELLAREKKSVVILDAFNARVNDILKNQQLESRRVLGASSYPIASSEGAFISPSLGLLQIKTSTPREVAIYDSPMKSTVLAQMMAEEILFYYKKSDGWYEVELKSLIGQKGWIEAHNVVELPR